MTQNFRKLKQFNNEWLDKRTPSFAQQAAAFLEFLNSFKAADYYDTSKDPYSDGVCISGPQNYELLFKRFSAESVSQGYKIGELSQIDINSNNQQYGTSESLFLSDLVYIFRSFLTQIIDTQIIVIHNELKLNTHIKAGQLDEAQKALTIIKELYKRLYQSDALSLLAEIDNWQNDQITLDQDLAFAIKYSHSENRVNDKSFISCADALIKLVEEISSWNYLFLDDGNQPTPKKTKTKDEKEKEPEQPSSEPLPTGDTVTPDDGGEDIPFPIPEEQPAQILESNLESYSLSLSLLSNSITRQLVSSLFAAYSFDENQLEQLVVSNLPSAQKQLFIFDSVPENLQVRLIAFIQPQIEHMLFSLNKEELRSLVMRDESSSALWKEMLGRAHRAIINYPPLKLLFQQALTDSFNSIKSKQEEGVDAEVLAENISTRTHEQANQLAERLIDHRLSTSPAEDEEERLPNLKLPQNAVELIVTNAGFDGIKKLISEEFRQSLGVDATKSNLVFANLEESIIQLLLLNPTIDPSFIDVLNFSQIVGMTNIDLAQEVYAKNEVKIKGLLKLYWRAYYAKLSKENASFAALQASLLTVETPRDSAVTAKNQLDFAQRLQAQTTQRNLQASQSLVPSSSERANTRRKKVRKSYLDYYLNSFDEKQRRRYLASLSTDQTSLNQFGQYFTLFQKEQKDDLESKKRAWEIFSRRSKIQRRHEELTRELFVKNLLDQQLAFDRYRLAVVEIAHQQAVATQQYLLGVTAQAEQLALFSLISGQTFLDPRFFIDESSNSPSPLSHVSLASLRQHQQGLEISLKNQAKNTAGFLAEKGVDAGLTYLSGGSYQALPKPVRDLVNQLIVNETGKALEKIVKGAILAAASAAALIAAALEQLGSIVPGIIAGGFAGGVTGVVFPALGPISGFSIGSIVGGSGEYFIKNLFSKNTFTNKIPLNSSANNIKFTSPNSFGLKHGLSQVGKQSLSQGIGNASSFGKSLFGTLKHSLFPKGIGASLFGGGISTGLFATTTTALAVGLPVALSSVTVYLLLGSHLTDFSENTSVKYSKYLAVDKTAVIINDSSGCAFSRFCPNPSFPIVVEYTVTIEPRSDYRIEINSIEDKTVYKFNKNEYPPPATFPNVSDRYTDLLPPENSPLILDPTDQDDSNDSYSFSYQVEYNSLFNHVLIQNIVKVNFQYAGILSSGTDTARSLANISIGNAPNEQLCWPNSGLIYSFPYEQGNPTHYAWDAYDITPVAQESRIAYAPYDGYISSRQDPSGYGNYIHMTVDYMGESYILIIAHLENTILDSGQHPSPYYVKKGEIIGTVGSTGNSTGPHVHFEKRKESRGTLSLTELMTGESTLLPLFTQIYSCAEY